MTVTLIDKMGSDIRIVNAARVSHAKQSDWVYDCRPHGPIGPWADIERHLLDGEIGGGCALVALLRSEDRGLIRYMMRNHHGTPFEHVTLTLHVECSIGVAREWMRHRLSSFNEVSTRYVAMERRFQVPEPRRQVGKAGHYAFEALDPHQERVARRGIETALEASYEAYECLLKLGVAKEVARNVLPLGLMTQFYWTVNLRSLFNFLALRLHPTALKEIRDEAEQVLTLAEEVAPAAVAAWEEFGRPTGDELHDCDSICLDVAS